jgi:hypothetical protein
MEMAVIYLFSEMGLALAIALVLRWFARLWHVPNALGKSKHNLLEMRRAGCINF